LFALCRRATFDFTALSVEEHPACFIVRDHSGQALAYVYFEDEVGPTLGSEIIGAGRGETDRQQYRQTAGAFAQGLIAVLFAD
jgi:hypothetical protein